MIIESLLQEQSTAEKVRDLQKNYLFIEEEPGVEDEYKQGKWGPETQKHWVDFLEEYSEEIAKITGIEGTQIAKDRGWSKQNKYAKSMTGVLQFMKDIKEIESIDQKERAKEIKKSDSEEEGRKEGAKDTPKKKEKPKPKLRYSEPSGNAKTSIDPLRIPASQIQNFLNTRIRFSDNTMMSDVPKKSWWNRYTEFDGRTVTDQEIKSAAIAKVDANKNITPTTKRKITKETTSSLNQMKGRALPVRPMMKDITNIDVVIFRDYKDVRDNREVKDCAVAIRYLYEDTPIPLIAITNLKYSKKQGVYAMTKVNESKNKLDSKLLRRLILKTLKENGEL
jgi:hypothetical protein